MNNFQYIQFKYFDTVVTNVEFIKTCHTILQEVCNDEFMLNKYPEIVIDFLKSNEFTVTRNAEDKFKTGIESYLCIYFKAGGGSYLETSGDYQIKLESKRLDDKHRLVLVHQRYDTHIYQQVHRFVTTVPC